MVNKAYRYRLYPTTEQKIMFEKTFGCARFIYNKMLGDRLDYYKETGKKLNNTPAQYKEEFPWLKEVDSLALANAQMNLNKAYNNFWSNRKHFGKPRFKSKKAGRASYSTNNQKGSVRIEGNRIKLPKIGWVRLCLHRPLLENSTIKTVTISRTPTGKYYISILVEYENQILAIIPEKFLGLDFAMHGLYAASDEADADYPISCRKLRKNWLRHRENFLRNGKEAAIGISRGCMWPGCTKKLPISAVASCIRNPVILRIAMMSSVLKTSVLRTWRNIRRAANSVLANQ